MSRPMPPAPTKPMTTEARTLISNEYRMNEVMVAATWGMTAKMIMRLRPAPTAFSASRGPGSTASTLSEPSLASTPMVKNTSATTPGSAPRPSRATHRAAQSRSGMLRRIVRMTRAIHWIGALMVVLDDARKMSGMAMSVPMIVATYAMRSVSSSTGQICGQAVQSGASRRKKFQKSRAPVNSDSMLKFTCWYEMISRAATMPSDSRLLSRLAAVGRSSWEFSGTTHVLGFVDGAAVDLFEGSVSRLFRRAVEHDQAVPHPDDAVRVIAGHVDEMQVDDGGDAVLAGDAFQVVHHGARGRRVQAGYRLVRQHDRRLLGQGAGDTDALLLAARKRS